MSSKSSDVKRELAIVPIIGVVAERCLKLVPSLL